MIIYAEKKFFTDGRTGQNYSSEPYKNSNRSESAKVQF